MSDTAHRFCNQHALDVAALVPSNLTNERSRHPKSRPPLSSRRDNSRRRMMTNRWINQPRLRRCDPQSRAAIARCRQRRYRRIQPHRRSYCVRERSGPQGAKPDRGDTRPFPSRRGDGKVPEATVANRYYFPLKQDQQYMFATFGASPSRACPVATDPPHTIIAAKSATTIRSAALLRVPLLAFFSPLQLQPRRPSTVRRPPSEFMHIHDRTRDPVRTIC